MRRGRKPTPTPLRLLRNNPGKRPFNREEPDPRAVLPDPPPALAGEALEEWKRSGPKLFRLGVMTELDIQAFTAYCQSWGRYVDAEARLLKSGEVVKAPSGYPIPNPYRAIANKALQQCREFWSEFGMMPSSRTRVKVRKDAPAAPQSKVDRFLKRAR